VYSNEPFYVTANAGWVRVGGTKWDNNDILEGKMGEIPLALFFRKRSGWAHETEWRMIQPLVHGIRMAGRDQNGHAVHLFEVPAAALQKVLFGYRARGRPRGRLQGIPLARRPPAAPPPRLSHS
jgi:hypothetical protein